MNFFGRREYFTELGIRSEIDYMNSGFDKLDILNDKYLNLSLSEKIQYLFPVIRFHDRYQKLTEFDIRKLVWNNEISYKGYLYDKKTEKYKYKLKNNYQEFLEYEKEHNKSDIENSDLKIPEFINEKIDLLIQLCKERDSELIIMTMPVTDDRAIEKHNIIQNFAKEKGVKYVDFNMEADEPINWETDTQDKGYHLNIRGAEKVGRYLSKYLSSNFDLENKKENPEYKKWNEALQAYNERKKEDNV